MVKKYYDVFKLCDLIVGKFNILGKMLFFRFVKGFYNEKGIKFVVVVKKKYC